MRDFVAGGCTEAAAAALPPIPVTVVDFCAGDAFVFRPDVIHAGDAFEVENVRCHCFLDTAALPGYVRRENGTFIPSDAEASSHYVPLGNLFLPHPDDERREALFAMQVAGDATADGRRAGVAATAIESGPSGFEQLLLVQKRVKAQAQRPRKRVRRKAALPATPSTARGECVAATPMLLSDAAPRPPANEKAEYRFPHADPEDTGAVAAARLFDHGHGESMCAGSVVPCVAAAASTPPDSPLAAVACPLPTPAYAGPPVTGDIDRFSACDPDCNSRKKTSSYVCINCS